VRIECHPRRVGRAVIMVSRLPLPTIALLPLNPSSGDLVPVHFQ
jgi:hypothetical protein